MSYSWYLAHLDDVVEERVRNFQELVWYAIRDYDHVALGDLPRLAADDAGAAKFIRPRGFGVDRLAAGDEFRGALEHIDHVSVLGVDFCLAGLLATAGVDHIVAAVAIEQHRALRECGVHFSALEVGDFR